MSEKAVREPMVMGGPGGAEGAWLLEAETDRRSVHGRPMGWDDLTFPGPAEVEIVD
ncbi:hypothetical protein [Streptomyces virginiae]|uniref:hypothetical protein n=1 Tax=Streptomyces virginiae TaxID=1961 RepID=UPI00324F0D98